ncbi:hypothetical protein M3Y95_00307100 [Aphelenchoides besseyi]|nr:hypothetical protein M3Y95_00307100 [Aphelenchoides besseyi]
MKVLLLVVLVVCSIFSFVNAGYGPPVLPQPYGGYGSQGGFGGSSFGGGYQGGQFGGGQFGQGGFGRRR